MLFEARLSISLESVQSPRKKQRAGTHIIWSHVLGSDCDCVVYFWQVISLFLFMLRHSLSCVKDDKFLFSVVTGEEIMLCWQPSVPSRGLKMKGFETLMGLWDSSSRWGFRSLGQHALRAFCICLGIIAKSCAVIHLVAQHSLGTFKLCPFRCWHAGFLSYLLVYPVWILLVITHTQRRQREHSHKKNS